MDKQKIIDFYLHNKGKVNGSGVGLFIGILILTIGFFKTLFLSICIGLGFFIGSKIDKKEDLIFYIEKLINTQDKRF